MVIEFVFGAALAVASPLQHAPAFVSSGEELKALEKSFSEVDVWTRQQEGVYVGHLKDGSTIRFIGQSGMDVRQEEIRSALANAELFGAKNSAGHEWMRKELAMLDQLSVSPTKSLQSFQNTTSICGVPMAANGTFSADLIPHVSLWIAGGASSVKVNSPFGPPPPVAGWVSHGWISHGVWVPSAGFSVGQFDNFFTVISSPPVTGSAAVPMNSACEIQIDATISVACHAGSANSNSYFTVTRWQTCEGVVAGSPIN
jgi:hypothetical protein